MGLQAAFAQSVTGKWYGIGNPDIEANTNSYLCEFIVTQNGNKVSGYFNYFFRNGYLSNRVTGTYDAQKRVFVIKPTPIIFYQTSNVGTGVDCMMTGVFVLKVSKKDATLTGAFLSDDAHKYTAPPLKIKFYKLAKDEPELKERIVSKKLVLEEDEPQQPAAQPLAKTTPEPQVAIPLKQEPLPPVQQAIAQTERQVKMRTNSITRILDVAADSVSVELYDNGQLDYDTISVFYNNKLLVHRQLLAIRQPISLTVFVDDKEENNDLLMFAENLGIMPPNSAIMIVTDRSNRYEIPLQSNYQKNGAVRLRKVQPPAADSATAR